MTSLSVLLLGLCLVSEPNTTELELLNKGHSQTSIDLAYSIGDETGDYNFLDEED
jgi:hypothetical protein